MIKGKLKEYDINLSEIPSAYTILYCPQCDVCNGFLIKKSGICHKCNQSLIVYER